MLSVEMSVFFALCVATTAALALLGAIVAMLRRSPFTALQSFLYAINYLIARILWRVEIVGSFPIVPGQGALIVCNHRCPLDPSFITLTTLRVVHWMVAREYCEYPAFRKLLQTCEAIPVRRESVDMAAVRESLQLLRQGEIVGLFPEGKINTTSELLLPGHPGAALIALKSGAPVVPCYIDGAPYDGSTLGCLLMPARVRLTIGRPIDPKTVVQQQQGREALETLTLHMLRAIARLAGRPDFEPSVIDRNGNDEAASHSLAEKR